MGAFRPRRRASRCLPSLLAAPLLALAIGAANAAGPAFAPDEVKAVFLYHFTKYVEWPAGRLAAGEPLVIATVCAAPFDALLAETVRGKQAQGRPLLVRPARYAEQARSAHLLYVCAEEEAAALALLEALRGAAVVTVGETAWFGDRGGMIVLVSDAGRLRFDINPAPAEHAGLRFSAQLRKLARGASGDTPGAAP